MYPRWLTWIFVLFLGYILVVGNFNRSDTPAVVDEPVAEAPAREYPKLSRLTDAEHWKKSIDPGYKEFIEACNYTSEKDALGLKVIVEREGDGDAARCGQVIEVTLKHWDDNARHFKQETLKIKLGAHKQPLALEAALVGLREGGERTIILPGTPVKLLTASRPMPVVEEEEVIEEESGN